MNAEQPVFRRSSFCVSGECVSVGFIPGHVLVRHHGDPSQTLDFSNAEWVAFVAGVKRGEFDVPGQDATSLAG